MKTIVLLCTAFFIFSHVSCKKDGDTPIVPVKTDSLGSGWGKKNIEGADLFDIFFNNNLSGYAVGNKMYKSTDGGNSWVQVFSDINIFNLFVTADNKAFFVKSGSGLLQTTPAQPALTQSISHTTSSLATDVFFTDNNNGYYLGDNKIYTTINGGSNWTPGNTQLSLFGSYTSQFFVSTSTGWIVNGNKIFKTDGVVLSPAVVLDNSIHITGIHALSSSVVYLGASSGKILKSTDGGSSFVLKTALPNGNGWTDIYFLDEFTGYASVDSRVFKTTDGAVSWTQVVNLANIEIKEIHFTDANHGWACGTNGTVLIFKQ